jgi:hypothetical protein
VGHVVPPLHSYVIPSEVEGPHKCSTRHASRRGPSTALRMTPLFAGLPPKPTTLKTYTASLQKYRFFMPAILLRTSPESS